LTAPLQGIEPFKDPAATIGTLGIGNPRIMVRQESVQMSRVDAEDATHRALAAIEDWRVRPMIIRSNGAYARMVLRTRSRYRKRKKEAHRNAPLEEWR
jgi:hypothetical protein